MPCKLNEKAFLSLPAAQTADANRRETWFRRIWNLERREDERDIRESYFDFPSRRNLRPSMRQTWIARCSYPFNFNLSLREQERERERPLIRRNKLQKIASRNDIEYIADNDSIHARV